MSLFVDEMGRQPGDLYDLVSRTRGGTGSMGLRERRKVDKLNRIANAAYKLFAREGYDGATLREIAHEAGVALGTLWLYARDKGDLILLIFNIIIPPMLERGIVKARKTQPLAVAMVAVFEPCYRAFAKDVTLYRIVLGEIYSGPASVHASETAAIRAKLLEAMAALIERAADSGECSQRADLLLDAKSFYFLYFAAVRAWLSQEDPNPGRGLAELLTLFETHMEGMRR